MRDIAAFVQCFYKDKTYKDILDYMEEQCENRPDNEYELDDGYFAIDNVFFDITSIEKMGFDKGVHMEVFPWGINYDQINPKRMLYYLCLKEEKNAWDIIEEMSDSEAHELVDYYRNHEKDDIRGFNSLCKAAGVDYNIGSSDQEPIIISTPEPEKTSNPHYCEECGKLAYHSIQGLSGATEWYCNDHWKQMQDMFDYMSQ